nr:AAA family ATPase [Actinomycetota bacterium]
MSLPEHEIPFAPSWLLDAAALLAEPDPGPTPWLVENLIVDRALVAVVGRWKTTKSYGVLDLCIAVATGRPAFGAFAVPDPGPVVFVNEESGKAALWRRLDALCRGRAIDPEELRETLFVAPNAGVKLDDEEWHRLLRMYDYATFADPVRLIVFDPLARMKAPTRDESARAGAAVPGDVQHPSRRLPSGVMDAGRRAEIRRWAQGLERSEVAELRAAARALGILVDENEKLARRLARLELDGGSDGGDAPASTNRKPPPGPPSATASGEMRRARRLRRERRKPPWRLAGTLIAVIVLVITAVALTTAAIRPEIETGGLEHGGLVGASQASQLTFWARTDAAAEPVWRLDGREIKPRRDQDRYVFRPGRLPDGVHLIEIGVDARWLGSTTRRIAFEVDTQPPTLRLDAPAAHTRGEPVHIEGTAEPGAGVLREGKPVPLDGKGRFSIDLSSPAAGGALVLELADRAGNRSRWRVPVTVVPRRPEHPVRSVHVTAHA